MPRTTLSALQTRFRKMASGWELSLGALRNEVSPWVPLRPVMKQQEERFNRLGRELDAVHPPTLRRLRPPVWAWLRLRSLYLNARVIGFRLKNVSLSLWWFTRVVLIRVLLWLLALGAIGALGYGVFYFLKHR